MLLFTLLFIFFSLDTLTINYDHNAVNMGRTPAVLMERLLSIHGILIFFSGVFVIFFVTRFTHKTAGPLFKIKRTIDTMVKGDLSQRIYLRKGDECKDIADSINRLTDIMAQKLSEIESIGSEMGSLIKSMESGEPIQSGHIEKYWDLHERLMTSLSYFTLIAENPED
jgi:methyl-accepting chemotaxis protein